MPAQVADWSEVKATAIATGSLEKAAEKHGIKATAVRKRAQREEWPVGRRVHKLAQEAKAVAHAQIIKSSNGTVTSVTSASDALSEVLAEDSKETRISLSRAARNLARQAETADLSQAGDALQTGKLAALTHGWSEGGKGSQVSINLLIQ